SRLVAPPLLIIVITRPPPRSTLFPYTTLFRSLGMGQVVGHVDEEGALGADSVGGVHGLLERQMGGVLAVTQGVEHQSFEPTQQRSEEHTSELQSRFDLVCRLLLEKKNRNDKEG